MLHTVDEGYSITDSLEQLPFTPVVVMLGGDIFSRNIFFVVVERVILFEAVRTFLDAAMLMFAAYFILNMEYPRCLGASLEFIERHIMNMPEERSTKQVRKSQSRKALKLIELLRLEK
ncbi:uncharacterized protein LOC135389627 [Ornithodoros turicata]|uniref:uncharacterized protein LOC135389627 n=1 Tax=Ornithodoros turicata TaxID=34597 RepID=UPI00313A3EB9